MHNFKLAYILIDLVFDKGAQTMPCKRTVSDFHKQREKEVSSLLNTIFRIKKIWTLFKKEFLKTKGGIY